MSLYDMWNGPPHPAWAQMLHVLGLLELGEVDPEKGTKVTPDPRMPRFRDIYPVLTDGVWELHLLTRAGAEDDYAEGVQFLRDREGYVADETWSTDSTYRTFRYAIDQEMFEGADESHSWPPIQERFDRSVSALGGLG